ncbi:MAG TPA: RNA polymerase sigma-70 factor [Gemmatimonadaceae bacterium]|jgi:RNA polymerase sigma factor, sigma-70 family/RNA polymerase sigma-70 factor, Bacteroides expansion family 1
MAAESKNAVMQSVAPSSEEREEHLPSERVSLSELRAGDDRAFDQVFRRFATPLTRYATRIVSSDAVAQDIVMDVFMRLWRDRRTLPADTRLAAYLKVSVRNSCIDHLRHDRIEASVQEIAAASDWAPAMSASHPMPDEELERREAKEAIRHALTTLPPRMRLVLELRWLGEKSYREISSELGIQVKSVENSLTRAMHILRELLRVDDGSGG